MLRYVIVYSALFPDVQVKWGMKWLFNTHLLKKKTFLILEIKWVLLCWILKCMLNKRTAKLHLQLLGLCWKLFFPLFPSSYYGFRAILCFKESSLSVIPLYVRIVSRRRRRVLKCSNIRREVNLLCRINDRVIQKCQQKWHFSGAPALLFSRRGRRRARPAAYRRPPAVVN